MVLVVGSDNSDDLEDDEMAVMNLEVWKLSPTSNCELCWRSFYDLGQ